MNTRHSRSLGNGAARIGRARAYGAVGSSKGRCRASKQQITQQLDAITAALANERAAEADGMKEVDKARVGGRTAATGSGRSPHGMATRKSKRRSQAGQASRRSRGLEHATAKSKPRNWKNAAVSWMHVRLRWKNKAASWPSAKPISKQMRRTRKLLGRGSRPRSSANGTSCSRSSSSRFRTSSGFAAGRPIWSRTLARRPEASQTDSAELVALRAERDALAERIEQLERQPVAQVDADTEQQISDLRRRFELAVEDVRELKTKNAKLEAKLVGQSAAACRIGRRRSDGLGIAKASLAGQFGRLHGRRR